MTLLKRLFAGLLLLGLFLVPAYYIYHSYDDMMPSSTPFDTPPAGKKTKASEARTSRTLPDQKGPEEEEGQEPVAAAEEAPPVDALSAEDTRAPESQPAASETGGPVNPISHLEPGFRSIEAGSLDQAEEYFDEQLRLRPLDPEGHFGLGIVHRFEGEFEQSMEDFSQTLVLNPSHLAAMFQVAEMYTFELRRDYETAEKYYQEILQEAPDDKASVNGLATIYLSTGRTDAAIQTWEGLRQEDSEETVISKNLGEAYLTKAGEALTQDNKAAARTYLQKAASINPEDPIYERKLKELGE